MSERIKIEIKEMPTKEQLERFLQGNFGHTDVTFDLERGKFVGGVELQCMRPKEAQELIEDPNQSGRNTIT